MSYAVLPPPPPSQSPLTPPGPPRPHQPPRGHVASLHPQRLARPPAMPQPHPVHAVRRPSAALCFAAPSAAAPAARSATAASSRREVCAGCRRLSQRGGDSRKRERERLLGQLLACCLKEAETSVMCKCVQMGSLQVMCGWTFSRVGVCLHVFYTVKVV